MHNKHLMARENSILKYLDDFPVMNQFSIIFCSIYALGPIFNEKLRVN